VGKDFEEEPAAEASAAFFLSAHHLFFCEYVPWKHEGVAWIPALVAPEYLWTWMDKGKAHKSCKTSSSLDPPPCS